MLDAGARVVDALEAAGGVRAGVDVAGLNLARVLVDGEQILVGRGTGARRSLRRAVPATGPSPAAPAVLVNLNTADEAAARHAARGRAGDRGAILSWRDEHGGFTSVDELLEVDGIGEATLAKIAPHVTV